jgi:hypothetical protein
MQSPNQLAKEPPDHPSLRASGGNAKQELEFFHLSYRVRR